MTLSDLENAILAALAPLKKPVGPVLTLESYAGQLDEIEGQAVRKVLRLPALYLAYAGGELNALNLAAGIYEHSAQITLLCAVSSLPGDREARQGIGQAGLYEILALAVAALSNQQLGLAIRPLEFQGLDLVKWSPDEVVFGLRFYTRFPWSVADEAA